MTESDIEILREPPDSPYCVLTLDDGYRAFVWHQNSLAPFNPKSSTFFRRQWTAFRTEGLSFETLVNAWFDLHWSLTYRGDWDAFLRHRFVHDLRYGMTVAIGYLLPRADDSRPVVIPRDVWVNPDFSWEHANVSGAGFEFAHVRIVMHERYEELHHADVSPEPLPDLAPFQPSDEVRIRWEIPASQLFTVEQTETKTEVKFGCPTREQAIIQAYHDISKEKDWKNKQLADAVRQRAKEILSQTSENGLSDATILRHVRKPWQAYRDGKSSKGVLEF